MRRALAMLMLAALGCGSPVIGQDLDFGQDPAMAAARGLGVLTIDVERAYRESEFGKRVAAELAVQGQLIANENATLSQELDDEEAELTDLRATLSDEEFRARAEAFDAKVQEIRRAQDAKARDLSRLSDVGQARFLEVVRPILLDLMDEYGAGVMLDRRDIFLGLDQADVTSRALSEINARIGTGKAAETGLPQ